MNKLFRKHQIYENYDREILERNLPNPINRTSNLLPFETSKVSFSLFSSTNTMKQSEFMQKIGRKGRGL
jgi:hypothetical protein